MQNSEFQEQNSLKYINDDVYIEESYSNNYFNNVHQDNFKEINQFQQSQLIGLYNQNQFSLKDSKQSHRTNQQNKSSYISNLKAQKFFKSNNQQALQNLQQQNDQQMFHHNKSNKVEDNISQYQLCEKRSKKPLIKSLIIEDNNKIHSLNSNNMNIEQQKYSITIQNDIIQHKREKINLKSQVQNQKEYRNNDMELELQQNISNIKSQELVLDLKDIDQQIENLQIISQSKSIKKIKSKSSNQTKTYSSINSLINRQLIIQKPLSQIKNCKNTKQKKQKPFILKQERKQSIRKQVNKESIINKLDQYNLNDQNSLDKQIDNQNNYSNKDNQISLRQNLNQQENRKLTGVFQEIKNDLSIKNKSTNFQQNNLNMIYVGDYSNKKSLSSNKPKIIKENETLAECIHKNLHNYMATNNNQKDISMSFQNDDSSIFEILKQGKHMKKNKNQIIQIIKSLKEYQCQINKYLDSGGQADVYEGIFINLNGVVEECVFKFYFNCYEDFKEELNNIQQMKTSINIVQTKSYIIVSDIIQIFILEKCEMSLRNQLNQFSEINQFKEEMLYKIMFDLLDGLIELRTYEIIHQDIKPSNILLNSKGNYVYCDLGIATKKLKYQETLKKGLTQYYGAPEQKNDNQAKINHRSDVYCLGKTFQQILKFYIKKNKFANLVEINNLKTFINDKMLKEEKQKRQKCIDLLIEFYNHILDPNMINLYEQYSKKIQQIIQIQYSIQGQIFSYFIVDQDKDIPYSLRAFYLYNLIQIHIQLLPYSKQFKISLNANETFVILNKFYGINNEIIFKNYQIICDSLEKIGDFYQKQNQNDISIKYYFLSLKIKSQVKDKLQQKIGEILINITDLNKKYVNYIKDIENYKEQLKSLKNNTDIQILSLSCNNNFKKIEEQINQRLEKTEIYQILKLVNKGGDLNQLQPNKKKSIVKYVRDNSSQYFQDLKNAQKFKFSNNQQPILQSIAGSYFYHLGDLKNSLIYHNQCLKIFKQQYGNTNNVYISYELNQIGLINQEMGNINESLDNFIQAFDINKQLYNKDHKQICNSLNNIGNCYLEIGELDNSQKFCLQALEISRKISSQNNLDTADYLFNLGKIEQERGNIWYSLQLLQQSLEMRQNVLTNLNNSIQKICLNLDYEYSMNFKFFMNIIQQNKEDELIQLLNRILSVKQQIKDQKQNDIMEQNILDNIKDQLQELYSKVINYNQSEYFIAKLIFEISICYGYLQDFKQQKICLDRAYQISQEIYKGDHPDVAKYKKELGKNYFNQQIPYLSVKFLEESLQMQKRIFKGYHHEIEETVNLLIQCYQNIDKQGLKMYGKELQQLESYKFFHFWQLNNIIQKQINYFIYEFRFYQIHFKQIFFLYYSSIKVNQDIKNITQLQFQMSRVDDQIFIVLKKGMQNLLNLTNLKFTFEYLVISEEYIEQLGNLYFPLINLQVLEFKFSKGYINQIGLNSLGQGLTNLRNLDSLSFMLKIDLEVESSFGKYLKQLKQLKNLEISIKEHLNCELDTIQCIYNGIKGLENLTQIYINTNSVCYLGEGIKTLKNLIKLKIKINEHFNVERDHFICLLDGIKLLKNIQYLSFSIKDDQQTFNICKKWNILQYLKQIKNLKISFGSYTININQLKSIIKPLKHLINLRSLSLKFKQLKDNHEDCFKIILGKMIEKQYKLKSLSIKIDSSLIGFCKHNFESIQQRLLGLKNLKKLRLVIYNENNLDFDFEKQLSDILLNLQNKVNIISNLVSYQANLNQEKLHLINNNRNQNQNKMINEKSVQNEVSLIQPNKQQDIHFKQSQKKQNNINKLCNFKFGYVFLLNLLTLNQEKNIFTFQLCQHSDQQQRQVLQQFEQEINGIQFTNSRINNKTANSNEKIKLIQIPSFSVINRTEQFEMSDSAYVQNDKKIFTNLQLFLNNDFVVSYTGQQLVNIPQDQLNNSIELVIPDYYLIGIQGAKQISQFLISKPLTSQLKLKIGIGNLIGDKGLEYICSSIKKLVNLVELEFHICENNFISQYSDKILGQCLQSLQNIQNLTIQITGEMGDSLLINKIGFGIQNLYKLQCLSITFNNFSEAKNLIGLSEGFQYLVSLTSLELNIGEYSNIGINGIKAFANAIKNLKYLIDFKLKIDSGHYIQEEGAHDLGLALLNLQNIVNLKLSIDELRDQTEHEENRDIIGLKGKEQILNGIKSLINLKELHLHLFFDQYFDNYQSIFFLESVFKNLNCLNILDLTIDVNSYRELLIIKNLANSLKYLQNLEYLQLQIKNCTHYKTIKILIQGFYYLINLHTFNFSFDDVYHFSFFEDWERLGILFKKFEKLQNLQLDLGGYSNHKQIDRYYINRLKEKYKKKEQNCIQFQKVTFFKLKR